MSLEEVAREEGCALESQHGHYPIHVRAVKLLCVIFSDNLVFQIGGLHNPITQVLALFCEPVMYAVGGWCDTPIRLEHRAPFNMWTTIAQTLETRRDPGVCALGEYIFAVGGHDGRHVLGSGEKYHVTLDTWSPISPMKTKRTDLAIAALHGIVYAVGGKDMYGQPLASGEQYNPETDSWAPIAALSCPRASHAMCRVGNFLYVVGGANLIERKVVSFDGTLWTVIDDSSMPRPRDHFGLCEFRGKIYVVGGWVGSLYTNGMLAYDPTTNKWVSESTVGPARLSARVCGVGDRYLMVVGGDGARGREHADEMYDFSTKEWIVLPDRSVGGKQKDTRFAHRLVLV